MVKIAVIKDGAALRFASARLRNNVEIVTAAIRNKSAALEYASKALRANEYLVLKAIKVEQKNKLDDQQSCFRFASDHLKQNKSFVLKVVKLNGLALLHANSTLKSCKEVVLTAVQNDGRALMYSYLKDDPEVVLEAIKQEGTVDDPDTPSCMQHACLSLRSDRGFVLKAVEMHGQALCFANHHLRRDREIVLGAVRQTGTALEHAAKPLQDDEEIVRIAVRNDRSAIRWLLTAGRERLGRLSGADRPALAHASLRLQSTESVVLEAVRHSFCGDLEEADLPAALWCSAPFLRAAVRDTAGDLAATAALLDELTARCTRLSAAACGLERRVDDVGRDPAHANLDEAALQLSRQLACGDAPASLALQWRARRRAMLRQQLELCAAAEARLASLTARMRRLRRRHRAVRRHALERLVALWPALDTASAGWPGPQSCGPAKLRRRLAAEEVTAALDEPAAAAGSACGSENVAAGGLISLLGRLRGIKAAAAAGVLASMGRLVSGGRLGRRECAALAALRRGRRLAAEVLERTRVRAAQTAERLRVVEEVSPPSPSPYPPASLALSSAFFSSPSPSRLFHPLLPRLSRSSHSDPPPLPLSSTSLPLSLLFLLYAYTRD
jgi:hypothetical protein